MPPRRTPPPLRGTARRPPPPIPVGRATLAADPHAPNVIIPVRDWDGRGVLPRLAIGDPGFIVCIVGRCISALRPAAALVRHPGGRTLWPYCSDHVWPYRPRKMRGDR